MFPPNHFKQSLFCCFWDLLRQRMKASWSFHKMLNFAGNNHCRQDLFVVRVVILAFLAIIDPSSSDRSDEQLVGAICQRNFSWGSYLYFSLIRQMAKKPSWMFMKGTLKSLFLKWGSLHEKNIYVRAIHSRVVLRQSLSNAQQNQEKRPPKSVSVFLLSIQEKSFGICLMSIWNAFYSFLIPFCNPKL